MEGGNRHVILFAFLPLLEVESSPHPHPEPPVRGHWAGCLHVHCAAIIDHHGPIPVVHRSIIQHAFSEWANCIFLGKISQCVFSPDLVMFIDSTKLNCRGRCWHQNAGPLHVVPSSVRICVVRALLLRVPNEGS